MNEASKKIDELVQSLEDGVYIKKNGTMKPITIPPSGYGKTVINWEASKPIRAEYQYSEKL